MARTKEAATALWRNFYPGADGIVYQYPAGHWDYASVHSEIGKLLLTVSEIYPGIEARQWERI